MSNEIQSAVWVNPRTLPIREGLHTLEMMMGENPVKCVYTPEDGCITVYTVVNTKASEVVKYEFWISMAGSLVTLPRMAYVDTVFVSGIPYHILFRALI